MSTTLGAYIRHLRRERSLTQTDLGGNRYSKSYVSAMERGSITPSQAALRFFSEQLAQPVELFEQIQQKNQSPETTLYLVEKQDKELYVWEEQQEVRALFNLALEGTNPSAVSLAYEMLALAHEDGAQQQDTSPQTKLAHTTLLQGLIAQEKGDLTGALSSLESALALAPTHLHAVILDALGTNYYLQRCYTQAIHYHQRARQMMRQDGTQKQSPDLPMFIELHCANDYRALAQHDRARDYYEAARQSLGSTHHLLLAARLCLGLGYCTYAALDQSQFLWEEEPGSSNGHEKIYQRAIGFLLQSRVLYQVSRDTIGVAQSRLMQAMILLDFSQWNVQATLEKARSSGLPPTFIGASLLDDAEEQCRQILMECQECYSNNSDPPEEIEILFYSALAYSIYDHIQRAQIARYGGYTSTVQRELVLAVALYQMVIDTCNQSAFPWFLVQQALSFPGTTALPSTPALPVVPEVPSQLRHPLSLVEMYQVAGRLAEEVGRSANEVSFASSCYQQADHYWQFALSLQHQNRAADPQRDISYLTRNYQRYISCLRERIQIAPEMKEETYPVLLALLDELLALVQESCGPELPARS